MTDKLTPKGEELLKYLMNEGVSYERILNTELDRITIQDEENATIYLVGYDVQVSHVAYSPERGYVIASSRKVVPNTLQ